jgi:hypothetical protein
LYAKQWAASGRQTRPDSIQNFFIRIARAKFVALPHTGFFGDRGYRGDAPDRPKRRRPNLNIHAVLEAYSVARNAGYQRRKTWNIGENTPNEVERLRSLQRRCRRSLGTVRTRPGIKAKRGELFVTIAVGLLQSL